jgi:hypothetical protein
MHALRVPHPSIGKPAMLFPHTVQIARIVDCRDLMYEFRKKNNYVRSSLACAPLRMTRKQAVMPRIKRTKKKNTQEKASSSLTPNHASRSHNCR